MRWWRSAPERGPCPDWLTARPYAHRGLHGGEVIENSLPAFEAAIERGFGIELDVRPSACGTPFVFHDAALQRLCGMPGNLADLAAPAVRRLLLTGSRSSVPALADVLELAAGRSAVLIEMKSDGRLDRDFCARVRDVVDARGGMAAIMSFDPRFVGWFAQEAPHILRGLVVSEEEKGKIKGFVERRLAVAAAKPDFLAYDIRNLPSAFAAAMRRRGRPILTWTVRTDAQAAVARTHADQIIHEWGGAQ